MVEKKSIPNLLREIAEYIERGEIVPTSTLSKKHRVPLKKIQRVLKGLGMVNTKSKILCSIIQECIKRGEPIPSIMKLAKETGLKPNSVDATIRRHKLPRPVSVSEQIRQEVQYCIDQDKEIPQCSILANKYGVSRQLVSQACKGNKTGWKSGGKKK